MDEVASYMVFSASVQKKDRVDIQFPIESSARGNELVFRLTPHLEGATMEEAGLSATALVRHRISKTFGGDGESRLRA